jgi:hypothetical protein
VSVGIVLRRLHAFVARIVASQPHEVDLFIVRRLHLVDFLLRKARVTDSLDALTQLAMNSGTRDANETADCEIDATGKLGIAVGASFVGRQFLQLPNDNVGRIHLGGAASRRCGTRASGRSWRLQHDKRRRAVTDERVSLG